MTSVKTQPSRFIVVKRTFGTDVPVFEYTGMQKRRDVDGCDCAYMWGVQDWGFKYGPGLDSVA